MSLLSLVGHSVVSAVIHAVIYVAAWRLLSHFSIYDLVGIVVLVIAFFVVLGFISRLFGRRRRW